MLFLWTYWGTLLGLTYSLNIPVLMSMLISRKLTDFRFAQMSTLSPFLSKILQISFFTILCISGSEGAHSQSIIPVQARVDVEMTELGEQE